MRTRDFVMLVLVVLATLGTAGYLIASCDSHRDECCERSHVEYTIVCFPVGKVVSCVPQQYDHCDAYQPRENANGRACDSVVRKGLGR